MAKNDVGIVVGVEGESAYRASIANIRKETRLLAAENKKLAAEYEGTEDSIEGLTKKSENLTKQLDAQNRSQKLIEEQIEKNQRAYERNSQALIELENNLNDAQNELEEMKKSSSVSSGEVAKQEALVKKLSKEYATATTATAKLNSKLLDLKTELTGVQTSSISTQRNINATKNQIDELGEATQDVKTKTSDFGDIAKKIFRQLGIDADDTIDSIIDGFSDYKGALGDSNSSTGVATAAMAGAITSTLIPVVGTLVGKIVEIGAEMIAAEKAFEKSAVNIQNALGLTEEEARSAKGELKELGGSFGAFDKGEAEAVLGAVMRIYQVSGDEAVDLSKKVQTISKTYGLSAEEIARTSKAMTIAFENENLTATQSLDLMLVGMQQSGVEAGEMLTAIGEYGVSAFGKMGYSSQQMVQALVAGAQEGALVGVTFDTVGDSVKTFYANASAGNDEFKQALKDLGFASESTIKMLLSDTPQAKQAYTLIAQEVSKISDVQKRNQIAATLWGSAIENSSIGVVSASAKAEASLGEVNGATAKSFDNITHSASIMEGVIGRASMMMNGGMREVYAYNIEEIKKMWGGLFSLSADENKTRGTKDGKAYADAYTEEVNKQFKINILPQLGGSGSNNSSSSSGSSNSSGLARSYQSSTPSYAPRMVYNVGGSSPIVSDLSRDSIGLPSSMAVADVGGVGGIVGDAGSAVMPSSFSATNLASVTNSASRQFASSANEISRVAVNKSASSAKMATNVSNVSHDTFNVSIDAKNVKEFNDIVNLAKTARQRERAR